MGTLLVHELSPELMTACVHVSHRRADHWAGRAGQGGQRAAAHRGVAAEAEAERQGAEEVQGQVVRQQRRHVRLVVLAGLHARAGAYVVEARAVAAVLVAAVQRAWPHAQIVVRWCGVRAVSAFSGFFPTQWPYLHMLYQHNVPIVHSLPGRLSAQGIELENPSARFGADLDAKDGTQSYFSASAGFRSIKK